MFRNSFIHKIFSEFLQPLRDVQNTTGFPVLDRGFRFYIRFWMFWLAWSTVPLLEPRRKQVSLIYAFQPTFFDIGTGEESVPLLGASSVLVSNRHCRLTVGEDVMVGEVRRT